MGGSIDTVLSQMREAGVIGPRGGNLENPEQNVEARRAPLNAPMVDGQLGLHRSKEYVDTATRGLTREQPWHRMAAYMLLNGRMNKEIAAAAGVEPNTVSVLRAQRWFQELVATLANESGQDITNVMAGEALASLQKIVEIRDDPDVSARTQLDAAKTIWEQVHGKPTQKIVTSNVHRTSLSPQEEMQHIKEELKRLQKTS